MHKTFSIQKSSYNKRALRHFCGSGVPPDFLTTTGSMGEDAHATRSTRMAENRFLTDHSAFSTSIFNLPSAL